MRAYTYALTLLLLLVAKDLLQFTQETAASRAFDLKTAMNQLANCPRFCPVQGARTDATPSTRRRRQRRHSGGGVGRAHRLSVTIDGRSGG